MFQPDTCKDLNTENTADGGGIEANDGGRRELADDGGKAGGDGGKRQHSLER